MTQTGEMLLFGFKQKLKRKMKPENLNLKYNISISGIIQARREGMICSVSLKNRDFKAERKYVSAILSFCSPFFTLSYSKVFFILFKCSSHPHFLSSQHCRLQLNPRLTCRGKNSQ